MALSVDITCGITSQLLLNDHAALNKPGILAPCKRDICDPIREGIAREGIELVEKAV